jgi:hypothetical protein
METSSASACCWRGVAERDGRHGSQRVNGCACDRPLYLLDGSNRPGRLRRRDARGALPCQRQEQRECRAPPGLAQYLDVPAHLPRYLPGDGKSESQPPPRGSPGLRGCSRLDRLSRPGRLRLLPLLLAFGRAAPSSNRGSRRSSRHGCRPCQQQHQPECQHAACPCPPHRGPPSEKVITPCI